ncbi:hypothetical protein J6590_020659 [Homalodisca vitripennis]|nr:hypothetical protein J6590_020659 [Homalodisca vitripennis]
MTWLGIMTCQLGNRQREKGHTVTLRGGSAEVIAHQDCLCFGGSLTQIKSHLWVSRVTFTFGYSREREGESPSLRS